MHGGDDPLNSERDRDVKKVFTGLTTNLPTGELQNFHDLVLACSLVAPERRRTLETGLWS